MRSAPFLSLSLLLVLAISTSIHAAEPTPHSLPEVQKTLKEKKGILLDVREKQEWDRGHIDGAVLMSMSVLQDDDVAETLKSLPKDKVIYTYCAVGRRAAYCATLLAEQGYQVQPLKLGYKDLIGAGFPQAME
ncbi:rhodanese-like domain-containing protein [Blastopirellula sp. JC732]|uniref:Rhodanese-like domain-containing protein n=1 Tax=Blastopirellula sediminis TaxID=2894196 RepID=A0A9X1MS73_9BACT|nr:rhodanese-like domain-containing protein [Blastopirellula sediminis]MCC9604899.1 rhodanese-like domain-containing protein [Blastopirellula sediminis]MCC9631801.1 rhodanese-like domain-containing protein [Blastopirellula sediminis]